MEHILTKTQELYKDIPTRLDLLRELNKRGALIDHEDLRKQLEWLERGFEGEQILLEYLEKHGENHWVILKNVWVKYYDLFECDLILITHYGIYIFEVKNYSGTFELKNNVGTINGNESSKHPITQGQNLVINLNKILQKSSNQLYVSGVVTFVGADNIVNIYDELTNIDVVRRNELRNYIWKIGNEERYSNGYPIDMEQILKAIDQYEVPPPHPPEKDIPAEVFQNVRGGICCCYCGNFDLKTTTRYIYCECGMIEPREEAIVRTICEYEVINYKQNLKTAELTHFFNGDISRSTVLRYLNTYFLKIGVLKNTEFINRILPFVQIYNVFGFKNYKYMRSLGPIIK